MCGRSSLTKNEKELEARFQARFYSEELERYNPLPNYNVAPTHRCPVITSNDSAHFQLFKWGLIPSWSKDEKMAYSMINARIETLKEKKTFSSLINAKRCLVPMDGFYEWKKVGKIKIPFRIQTAEQDLFSCAGLWDQWYNEKGEKIHTFTIITLPANEFMSQIHDRMPAILSKDQERHWLDDNLNTSEYISLLQTNPNQNMIMYEVDPRVGNVRENDKALIEKFEKKIEPQQGSLFE
jgi:putative SOS response-associated peptidase YedK